jgi:hypothetical protein
VVYAHGDEAGLGRNKLPRLMDCVVDPRELLVPNSRLRLNGYYYITKQVQKGETLFTCVQALI